MILHKLLFRNIDLGSLAREPIVGTPDSCTLVLISSVTLEKSILPFEPYFLLLNDR